MATVTPFVKRMRTQGGTIYTFSSALEDIGLNINERNNVVKMSHYALLNIPSIDAPPNLEANRFNVLAIPGALESWADSGHIKDGRVIVAESFQNYALNLETILLSQPDYNAALNTTVSERVFWKWIKETGAIRWVPTTTPIGTYWEEEIDTDSSVGYNSLVKGIGTISAGSVRTDSFGTYNETYVLVPTSFGQTPVYFKQVEDDNYMHGMRLVMGPAYNNIYGRESYTRPHPDALEYAAYYDYIDSSTAVSSFNLTYDADVLGSGNGWWWTAENLNQNTDTNAYYTDTDAYLDNSIFKYALKYDDGGTVVEFARSTVDCMSIEFDIQKLQGIMNDSTMTYDDLAMKYAEDDDYDFNAILIYYSVYNRSLDKVLATNLLGILFLDPPSGNTQDYPLNEIIIPSITKLQSGPSGFGTSYSFRLNIKSDYMIDDTQAIIEDSTGSQTALTQISDIFDNLGKSLGILNQQAANISYITEQYLGIQSNQTNVINELNELQQRINKISRDIGGVENTIAMFSDGDDPLIESSIYMRNGNVGFFNDKPSWPVQIDASLKVSEIYTDTFLKDPSGNPLHMSDASIYQAISDEIVVKADIESPVFNTSISLGDWTFGLDSANNLVLSYDSDKLFKFTTDGSFYAVGDIESESNEPLN